MTGKNNIGEIFEIDNRDERALNLLKNGSVILYPFGGGLVIGSTDSYTVTSDFCECPDRQFRGKVCKHMRAYRLAKELEKIESSGGDDY